MFLEYLRRFLWKISRRIKGILEFVKDFVIEVVGQVSGVPFLSAYVRAITNLGRWIWKKIKRKGNRIFDEDGNVIGHIDQYGNAIFYYNAVQYMFA